MGPDRVFSSLSCQHSQTSALRVISSSCTSKDEGHMEQGQRDKREQSCLPCQQSKMDVVFKPSWWSLSQIDKKVLLDHNESAKDTGRALHHDAGMQEQSARMNRAHTPDDMGCCDVWLSPLARLRLFSTREEHWLVAFAPILLLPSFLRGGTSAVLIVPIRTAVPCPIPALLLTFSLERSVLF